MGDPMLFIERKRIAQLALAGALPSLGWVAEMTDAGLLMSYGPNFVAQYRRVASYVDRILRGAKPADLPVEQPETFELVINSRIAKALGVSVPPALLARADRVIE
jgi:putative ABC transport system substrate-binding protein